MNPAPPRRKSCLACIHAKSRCDSRAPGCGPCQRKGRECIYSSESLSSGEGQSIHSPTRPSPEQQSRDVARVMPVAIQETLQSTSLDLSMLNTSEESLSSLSPGHSITRSSESGDLKSVGNAAAPRVALGKPDMPAIRSGLETPCALPPRLLQPKERQTAKTVLVTKLVSHVLCSFPERKMNETSCPPFIHHFTFLRSLNVLPSDDPIGVCQNITHKFATRKREASSDFSLWDAIAAEQERIYEQRASFNKWLHLSAAQPVTIYLLMLAAEGESVLAHHPTLPITLLFTLGTHFVQLNQMHPGFVAAIECAISHGLISGAYKLTYKSVSEDIIII
jgi:hypothetical protein